MLHGVGRTRCLSIVVLAAFPLLAGCGGDDEKSPAASSPGAPATATAAPDGKTFKADDVGFTFRYPDGFTQVDEPNDGEVLALVSPEVNDPNNGVKVRMTADKELRFSSYGVSLRRQFQQQLGTTVKSRTESHNGVDFGVLEWSKDISQGFEDQQTTTRVHSSSYFFPAAGKTWQLECISDAGHRAQITAACDQALGSIGS